MKRKDFQVEKDSQFRDVATSAAGISVEVNRGLTVFCVYCETGFKDGEVRWDGRAPAEIWHYKCASRVGLTPKTQEQPSLAAGGSSADSACRARQPAAQSASQS